MEELRTERFAASGLMSASARKWLAGTENREAPAPAAREAEKTCGGLDPLYRRALPLRDGAYPGGRL